MTFSEKSLDELRKGYSQITAKKLKLFESFFGYSYQSSRAKEYAIHGFSRRLIILVRCIQNVFHLLPPESSEVPTENDRIDAEINVQAFIFNIFGCIDNLAWIWVYEKEIKDEHGQELDRRKVGLGPKYQFLRKSFSMEFQAYLKLRDDWFGHLEDYRNALAHRIPIYIPPFMVHAEKEREFLTLQVRLNSSEVRKDIDEYDRVSEEQKRLGVFRPQFFHSLEENPDGVFFHHQMLVDFITIEEFAKKMLVELDRK